MPALIDQTNLAVPKFETGDAGIIFKANGELVIWNTFADPMNPSEQQIETGRALIAFAAASKLPAVMNVLYEVANDKTIFHTTLDTGPRQ